MTPIAPLLLAAAAAAGPTWRSVPPEDLLLIDTGRGRIAVELTPELAPRAVERIRLLARRGTYDGLLFHRVIDHFVDQSGNPDNHDGGGTELPDLEPEFDGRVPLADLTIAARPAGAVVGFLKSLPVEASARIGPDAKVRTWALYCAGVMGMGRQAGWGTANSEIFFMRDPARRLDHDYTAVGRVLVGLDVVRQVAVGIPPADPDRMLKVRLAADLPPAARPQLRVEDERSPRFQKRIAASRQALGADFSPCAVPLSAHLAPSRDP